MQSVPSAAEVSPHQTGCGRRESKCTTSLVSRAMRAGASSPQENSLLFTRTESSVNHITWKLLMAALFHLMVIVLFLYI